MEFFRKAEGVPARLGILAGAFHPPTVAHLAIARAALSLMDEVLFVLPREFPHKQYQGIDLEKRLQLLLEATSGEPRFSVGVSEGGLFIEIARECRVAYGPVPELWFLCGSDAAERIVNWDYGLPGAFGKMLDEFGLLVVDRGCAYDPPFEMQDRIRHLSMSQDFSEVSATEVRSRIARNFPWEHLVPESVVELIRSIYELDVK